MVHRFIGIVLLIIAGTITTGYCQEYYPSEDLRSHWMCFDGQIYLQADELSECSNTIHFVLQPGRHQGEFLLITSPDPVDVYVEGKILSPGVMHAVFAIDSLFRARPAAEWMITIWCGDADVHEVETFLATTEIPQVQSDFLERKGEDFYLDFIILVSLIVLTLYIISKTIQPRITAHYFSFRQFFTRLDSDEAQLPGVTTTGNLFFWVQCALMVSFCLVMLDRFVPNAVIQVIHQHPESLGPVLLIWLKLAGLTLCVLVIKWILIYLCARMFGLQDTWRIHFLNWIRLLFVFSRFFLVVVVGVYLARGGNVMIQGTLGGLIVGLCVVWFGIIFYKLSGYRAFSVFHIISYLCLTEFIPLLILSKILYA